MKKTIMLLLFVMIAYGNTIANEFSVLALKGQTQLKKGSKWISLKSGDKLFKDQIIKLGKDSYIGMVHANGSTIEIKESGTYNVSALSRRIKGSAASTTKRMADYVMEEMSSADDLFEKDDYHGSMSTLGSVERAVGDDINAMEKAEDIAGTDHSVSKNISALNSLVSGDGYNTIRSRLPGTSYIIDRQIEFSWDGAKEVKSYLIIKDDKNKILLKKEVSGSRTAVNLEELGVIPGKCYYWKVESGDNKSVEYCIVLMDKQTFPDFFNELSEIESGFGKELNAIEETILAAFYEKYNVMNRAYTCYRNAVLKSGNSPDMEKLFAAWMERTGVR